MDVRLPAALSLETNDLVDVHDVARGRGCNCICPSCGQGLQAKQGETLFWHFAHDHDSEHQPKQVCNISFSVVAKNLAIQLMLAEVTGWIERKIQERNSVLQV